MKELPKPAAPLGAAIQWNKDDIKALAAISLHDIKAALALWQTDAPARYKTLLLASREGVDGIRRF